MKSGASDPSLRSKATGLDAFLRALCAAVPAVLAAAGAASTTSAAHDLDVVRTVGAGFAGPGGAFRALDLLAAAPALLLPFGTRVLRAGLASALITGICGALAFDLARELVGVVASSPSVLRLPLQRRASRVAGAAPDSSRLVSAVSAVAVLTALLAPVWQSEASAPGGAVIGALLVLLALRFGVRRPTPEVETTTAWAPPLLFVLGLSASYEPLVFVAALAAVGPRVIEIFWQGRKAARVFDRQAAAQATLAFVLGLVPLVVGILVRSRTSAIAVEGSLFTLLPGERATGSVLTAFALDRVGPLLLIACGVGAALSFGVERARRIALPLVLVAAVGVLALRLDASPARFAPALLVGLLAAFVLAATTLGMVVLAISRARVPFAEASAALVVVLELVLPVRSMDETSARREARAVHAAAIWNDVAWGDAPPAAVVLVSDRGTMRRIASTRAMGMMRGDLVMVPAYDVQGREGQRSLIAEPKLAPLYRDMALGIPPEELSLAQLGAQRPVLATFDPKWDRSLSRHLVPTGLTSRFETEPRGTSERKKALDGFTTAKDRLVRITVAKKDAELASATAALLRARAIGMAATGEREMLARALDDLRAFAPEDPIGATLVRRTVTSRGAIDVHDLTL
jgi:hypothetical protein